MTAERLNWQQACHLLGCCKSQFYKLVNSGELPSERYGKVKGVTVKKADCERYLQQWQERMELEEEADQAKR